MHVAEHDSSEGIVVPIVQPGSAPTPKRGTSAWFRQIHPFSAMDPDAPPVPVTWLVPGIIMQHKINFMFGPEKAGKSRFLRFCLAHMMYDRNLWGGRCAAPSRVLYLAGEEQPNDMTHGLMSSVRSIGADPRRIAWADRFTIVQAAGMRMDRNDVRQWLKHEIMTGRYDTLIIDPLRRVHGASESSNDEMSQISNAIRDWSNTLGLTILIIHHTGKLSDEADLDRIATWSRGASDIASVLDWATFLKREGNSIELRRDGRAAPRPVLTITDEGEGRRWHCSGDL